MQFGHRYPPAAGDERGPKVLCLFGAKTQRVPRALLLFVLRGINAPVNYSAPKFRSQSHNHAAYVLMSSLGF